jgi:hypothetical protein
MGSISFKDRREYSESHGEGHMKMGEEILLVCLQEQNSKDCLEPLEAKRIKEYSSLEHLEGT